jgi:hypothetical protein
MYVTGRGYNSKHCISPGCQVCGMPWTPRDYHQDMEKPLIPLQTLELSNDTSTEHFHAYPGIILKLVVFSCYRVCDVCPGLYAIDPLPPLSPPSPLLQRIKKPQIKLVQIESNWPNESTLPPRLSQLFPGGGRDRKEFWS